MKIVAAVFADFVEAPTGGPAQLCTALAGEPLLLRMLRRLMRVDGLAARCLFVRARDGVVAAQMLRETGLSGAVDLVAEDPGTRPRRQLVQAARKWALESWRGNPLGLTWFDEFVDPAIAALVVNRYQCDAVFCFDGHQPVLDPAIASAMVAHAGEHEHECKVVFTQAPPGLAGVIVRRDSLRELLEFAVPFGLLLSYRPELAQTDPITHAACYHLPPLVAQTATRLTGDTRRSRELLELALRELGPDASAVDLCRWVGAPGHDRAGPLPVEVELELTTDDPLPDTTLRPRGDRVPRRRLDDLAAIDRLANQLAQYDDRLVFLGGHGDPLQHPQLPEICRRLRAGGVYGIGVGTPLLDLTEEQLEALFAHRVDVVEVRLDAHSAATYQRVHGRDGFDRVVANIMRLEQDRKQRQAPQPIVVCSQTRCAATIQELEAFHDHWIKVTGSAVIHGYNDSCGVLAADTLLPTCPAVRGPCRRLSSRMVLLADGTVPLCGQDFSGEVWLGDWRVGDLREIWTGPRLNQILEQHARLDLGALRSVSAATNGSARNRTENGPRTY